jgi:hypothetical protein
LAVKFSPFDSGDWAIFIGEAFVVIPFIDSWLVVELFVVNDSGIIKLAVVAGDEWPDDGEL